MNGEAVGIWSVGRTGNHRFAYEPTWRDSPRVRALSLSLPITASGMIEGAAVRNYFDNLLPDNEGIRRRLHTRFGTKSADTFDLLQAIGRDCVGAVQLLPLGAEPEHPFSVQSVPLTNADVEQILLGVPSPALGHQHPQDNFRISIAGAQEKTALLRIGTQWYRPLAATPTTHILKLPLGVVGGTRQIDLSTSIENEWLCLRILEALGLPVAKAEIGQFGDQKALIVERFDRAWVREDQPWIARLPQEDFCQVRGVASSRKYESDGGPGLKDCLAVLANATDAERDVKTFLGAQFAFWLLAATDGHAKNFSIFLNRGGHFSLTPLYDVLSAWPVIGTAPNQIVWQKATLAMAVRSRNAHYKLCEIQSRHWQQLARSSGIPDAWDALLTLSERVPLALEAVAKEIAPQVPVLLAEAIFDGVRRQNADFRRGLAAL